MKKPFAVGSKSETQAIVLETDGGDYVLRIVGGHPFQDPRLEALVGKTIRATGTLHAYTLIATTWVEE